MEFTIDRNTFARALQKVQGIVEKRNTMPILSNVLLEAQNGTLSVTATDLEVGMKSYYQADIIREGKITLSAKKIYEIIKELPQDDIKFCGRENDWVEMRCGKSKFNIVGLSPDEFPYFPKVNDMHFATMNSSLLSEMIEKTAYAMCTDETKYNLNGIYFKLVNENETKYLRLVATDGHRLSMADTEIRDEFVSEFEKGVIFPKKGVYEIRRLTEEIQGDISIGFMDNNVIFKKDETYIVMRLVDGEFPDYKRVIPVANDRSILIKRAELLHALKRMAIMSSEKFKGIKFDINKGILTISSNNPEFGEGFDEIEIEYDGEAMISRFNARYLIDILSILQDDKIELLLKDEMSPAILKSIDRNDFKAVVMPMRL